MYIHLPTYRRPLKLHIGVHAAETGVSRFGQIMKGRYIGLHRFVRCSKAVQFIFTYPPTPIRSSHVFQDGRSNGFRAGQ